jgi:hypothetical protein
MNLETQVVGAEAWRQLSMTLHHQAANCRESLARDQLVFSVQLAAGPPQLFGSSGAFCWDQLLLAALTCPRKC